MIIGHTGIVEKIEDKTILVKITSQAACASCHAKGACGGLDSEEKIVEVRSEQSDRYQVGQEVEVSITQKLGFLALFWGYIAPFVLVFTVLLTVYLTTSKQELAGLCSLAILIPYYLTLYFFREKLYKTFLFQIK